MDPKIMRALRRRPRGMTLVEVLMAGAILTFGMVGIMALLGTAHRSHRIAVHETNAVQIAQSVMAEYRSYFARGVVPGGHPRSDASDDYPDYKYEVKVTDLRMPTPRAYPEVGREFYVEVRVFWDADQENKKSSLFQTIMFLIPQGK